VRHLERISITLGDARLHWTEVVRAALASNTSDHCHMSSSQSPDFQLGQNQRSNHPPLAPHLKNVTLARRGKLDAVVRGRSQARTYQSRL